MSKVVGIGSAVFDILMKIDSFPVEDTKLQGKETKLQCGGPCATALVAMSKLGEPVCYMGNIGDDMYGSFVTGELKKYGVNVDDLKIVHGTSFHSFVMLNQSSTSRTCVWNRGTVAQATKENVNLDVLKQARYLHMDGLQMEASIFAAQKAHEYGVTVSLDAGGVYPGLEQLLPLIDVLIPSEEWALKVTGCATAVEAAVALQEKYDPDILIITQGNKGGFIWENGKEVRYPVFPVQAIDSNGAGDTFHGAFLAGRLKGMSVYDSCVFASATAALKCTRFGAQEGIPTYEEVMEFIRISS